MTPARIVLDNRVRVPLRLLGEELRAEIYERFTYENPDAKKAKAYGFRRRIPPTIVTARREGEYLTVPRGGLADLREILQRAGRWMRVDDQRYDGEARRWTPPPMQHELYPYQRELVARALEQRCCLWRSPQASGKTQSALGYACALGLPTLVIVYTSNLLDQWVRRIVDELGSEHYVGVIQGSRRYSGKPITVAMQQTLWRFKPEELRGKFGAVIADEVQLFASATFQKVIGEIDAAYVLGVSGDERRSDGKEFLIYDQFGDIAAEVRHDDLVDAGYVHEVEVRVVPTEFRADWYKHLPTPAAKVKARDRLLVELGADAERNSQVVELAYQVAREGRQALVLTSRRDHCHAVDALLVGTGLRSGLLIGGDDYRQQFRVTLDGILRGERQVAVGTLQAIGVGFDLPHVARGIIIAPVASNAKGRMQWQQFRGRFARTAQGKADAVLYYLHDGHVFGDRAIENLARWNRDVKVWHREQWVDAKSYLKERKHETKERQEDPFGADGATGEWDPDGSD